jgi:hypothetical protein
VALGIIPGRGVLGIHSLAENIKKTSPAGDAGDVFTARGMLGGIAQQGILSTHFRQWTLGTHRRHCPAVDVKNAFPAADIGDASLASTQLPRKQKSGSPRQSFP